MERTLMVRAVSFKERSFKTEGGWVRVNIPGMDLIELRVGKTYRFDVSQNLNGEWVATKFHGEAA